MSHDQAIEAYTFMLPMVAIENPDFSGSQGLFKIAWPAATRIIRSLGHL
jgi:hypothetical protein